MSNSDTDKDKLLSAKDARKVGFLQLAASILTILFISLPILFSISSGPGFSFSELVAATSNPGIVGAYLFVNIAVGSIWLPVFLLGSERKKFEKFVKFGFFNEMFLKFSLCYLFFIVMYSAYLYGLSVADPQNLKTDAISVARVAAVTIIIHLYLDVLFAVKTTALHKLFKIE